MLGNKIKELREQKGISQNEISKILNIQQASYSNYENNKREPNIETLKKLASFYKISLDELLEYKTEEKPLTKEEIHIIKLLENHFIKNKKEG